MILGPSREGDADYLNSCQIKRNTAEYDRIGAVSGEEAEELLDFVMEFRADVLRWMEERHPELIGN